MVFSNKTLSLDGQFELGDHTLSVGEVFDVFSPMLTEDRLQKMDQVIAKRTFQLSPVMEHIYDRGNISAVMRSAEAFGFFHVNIIEQQGARFKDSNRVSKGTEKWLDTHRHVDSVEGVKSLQAKGYQVMATHLDASIPISQVDFTKPTAVVFGNEKDGVSEELLSACDGRFILPMNGFAQSFNISVAAALTFYHVSHFFEREGLDYSLSDEEQDIIKANYILRCIEQPTKVLDQIRISKS